MSTYTVAASIIRLAEAQERLAAAAEGNLALGERSLVLQERQAKVTEMLEASLAISHAGPIRGSA